mgnify:CR=1 FL=1
MRGERAEQAIHDASMDRFRPIVMRRRWRPCLALYQSLLALVLMAPHVVHLDWLLSVAL